MWVFQSLSFIKQVCLSVADDWACRESRKQAINLHLPLYFTNVGWWEGQGPPSPLQASMNVVSVKSMLSLPCRRDFAPYSMKLGKPKGAFLSHEEGSSVTTKKRARSGAYRAWICTGCRWRDPIVVNAAMFCEQGRSFYHATEIDLRSKLLYKTLLWWPAIAQTQAMYSLSEGYCPWRTMCSEHGTTQAYFRMNRYLWS